MSNFYCKIKIKETWEIFDAEAMDDHFWRHEYWFKVIWPSVHANRKYSWKIFNDNEIDILNFENWTSDATNIDNDIKHNSPLKSQVGWDHYKKYEIQPFEYIVANKLWFWEWAVIKYVTRWRDKDWVRDLRKAIHCIEMMIELEEKYGSKKWS